MVGSFKSKRHSDIATHLPHLGENKIRAEAEGVFLF